VLVLTEGLLQYQSERWVAELAQDLGAEPSFRWWVTDLISPRVMAWMKKRETPGNPCAMHFAPEAGAGFFDARGWTPRSFHSYVDEAERLNRRGPQAGLWKSSKSGATSEFRAAIRKGGIALLENGGCDV
jgi:hypothetical protein